MTSLVRTCTVALLVLGAAAHGQSILGTVSGSVPFDNVGAHVAILGDLDGDGRDDLALGSGGGELEPGVVRVLSGADMSELHVVAGAHPNDKAHAVARLGDIDGDGVGEFMVGAWGDDLGGNESGSVTVYSGATAAVLHTLPGPQSSARFGWSLASAGDVDGDGLDDIVVGAPATSIPASVYVHSSATWGLLLVVPGDGESLGLGRCVASIEDLDGDAKPDVLVGLDDSNRVRVHSSADGTVLLQVDGPPGKFGRSVASIGDLDGDGLDDIAVGAPELATVGLPLSGPNTGTVQVHSSVTGALIASHVGATGGSQFGHAVAPAGDVDGDGFPDVIASAPFQAWDNPAEPGGVILAIASTGDLLSVLRSSPNSSGLGLALAGGGDVNGDGHPDFAAGSPNDDLSVQDEGRALTGSFRFRVRDAYPDHLLFSDPGTVSLFGGGFEPGSPIDITLAGQPATNVTWLSKGILSFVAPPGLEDSLAELVFSQDGLDVVVPKAFVYEGARIIDTTPDNSPMAGGFSVTIWGEHFTGDGSAVVKFLDAVASIVSVASPSRIDVTTPPFTPAVPATPWIVQVSGSTGTFDYQDFTYKSKFCAPERGNIAGGLPVTIFGMPGHLFENITVYMGVGGPPCELVSVVGKQINIITPPVPEPTGTKTELFISDPVGGNESVNGEFLYTPWLDAEFEGNGFHGGTLSLRWITDPAVSGTQLLTLWLGIPQGPSFQKGLPGYSGLLREVPYAFLFIGLPEPPQPQVIRLHVPPLEAALSGLPLKFQSLVTGEGGPKGSFTNVAEVELP